MSKREYQVTGTFENGEGFELLIEARNGWDAMYQVRNFIFPKVSIKSMSAGKVVA
jgi:hypothetical protein